MPRRVAWQIDVLKVPTTMPSISLGFDLTVLPIRVAVLCVEDGVPPKWNPVERFQGESAPGLIGCNAVSLSRDRLVPEKLREKNALRESDDLVALTKAAIRSVQVDLTAVRGVAIACSALAAASAITTVRKVVAQEVGLLLADVRSIPAAWALVLDRATPTELGGQGVAADVITCTRGLTYRQKNLSCWEWCRFRRVETHGEVHVPLCAEWFASELRDEDQTRLWGIDRLDLALRATATPVMIAAVSGSPPARLLAGDAGVVEGSGQFRELLGRRVIGLADGSVSRGAALFAQSGRRGGAEPQVAPRLPIPRGLIGTVQERLVWRELLPEPEDEAPVVFSPNVQIAALHGFASVADTIPRWQPVEPTTPSQLTYLGRPLPSSQVKASKSIRVVHPDSPGLAEVDKDDIRLPLLRPLSSPVNTPTP
jgi:hypothetical protein